MMAVQRWTLTTFSEKPQWFLTTMFYLIHLKKLNISAVTIKICDFQCADFKIIGYEINNGIIARIIYSYESHILRIELAGLVSEDMDPRVLYDACGRVGDGQLLDPSEQPLINQIQIKKTRGYCN